MGRYFLGVDGGQSSTAALVGDERGRVLGEGIGGPCNHVSGAERRAKFVGAVGGCIREACAAAGLVPEQVRFEAGCFGFSGGAADKRALVEELVSCERLEVTHDAAIALAGATGGLPGVIAIAGTGSMAFGRNGAGVTARAGGWGYVFGDEGGGFDLVRQALRAALRYEEGWGPPTSLRERLLAATGASDANDLLHRFYTEEYPRSRVATFSTLVEDAASEGDAVAGELLGSAAQELAMLVAAVRRQLFPEGELAVVSYCGGLFGCDRLRERFRMLVELDGGVRFGAPRTGPAEGALFEAYRLAGLQVSEVSK